MSDQLLAPWPLSRKPNWRDHVNAPQTEAEIAALRRSIQRGCPFGDEPWSNRTVRSLGLESTLRPAAEKQRFLTPLIPSEIVMLGPRS